MAVTNANIIQMFVDPDACFEYQDEMCIKITLITSIALGMKLTMHSDELRELVDVIDPHSVGPRARSTPFVDDSVADHLLELDSSLARFLRRHSYSLTVYRVHTYNLSKMTKKGRRIYADSHDCLREVCIIKGAKGRYKPFHPVNASYEVDFEVTSRVRTFGEKTWT